MTPIYHDNVSQFRHIGACRAQRTGWGYRKRFPQARPTHEQNMRKWRRPIFGPNRAKRVS